MTPEGSSGNVTNLDRQGGRDGRDDGARHQGAEATLAARARTTRQGMEAGAYTGQNLHGQRQAGPARQSVGAPRRLNAPVPSTNLSNFPRSNHPRLDPPQRVPPTYASLGSSPQDVQPARPSAKSRNTDILAINNRPRKTGNSLSAKSQARKPAENVPERLTILGGFRKYKRPVSAIEAENKTSSSDSSSDSGSDSDSDFALAPLPSMIGTGKGVKSTQLRNLTAMKISSGRKAARKLDFPRAAMQTRVAGVRKQDADELPETGSSASSDSDSDSNPASSSHDTALPVSPQPQLPYPDDQSHLLHAADALRGASHPPLFRRLPFLRGNVRHAFRVACAQGLGLPTAYQAQSITFPALTAYGHKLRAQYDFMAAVTPANMRGMQLRTVSSIPGGGVLVAYKYREPARMAGLATESDTPDSAVTDKVQLSHQEALMRAEDGWRCPLCTLLGRLPSKTHLMVHLAYHHPTVGAEWKRGTGQSPRESAYAWHLLLTISAAGTEEVKDHAQTEFVGGARLSPAMSRNQTPFPHLTIEPPKAAQSIMAMKPENVESSLSKPREPSPDIVMVSQEYSLTSQRRKRRAVQSKAQIKIDPESLSGPEPSPAPSSSRSASASLPTSRTPHILALPVAPPPPSDPLGPAARAPYHPFQSVDGETSMDYSCRPGGERLFDLLNVLPLDEFGVLAWTVVDREEEIFELDDVRDEDKVVAALWARWIVRHRANFIKDYCEGVRQFINHYWKIIHHAAGWAALRVWLLMLCTNRYLKPVEIANLLKHYENLTKMDHWYSDDEDDQ